MPDQRRDLFGECNVDRHPIDVFTKECCANCRNPECTRSLVGKLMFDQRAAGWYEKFYGNKDTMPLSDPRFLKIAAQTFIPVEPGLVSEVGGGPSPWIDPRRPEPRIDPEPTPEPSAATAPTEPPVPRPAPPQAAGAPRTVPQHLLLANAPPQVGRMIAAPPSAVPATPVVKPDPWAGPVSVPKSDVPVVSPGARVKLGGSGV